MASLTNPFSESTDARVADMVRVRQQEIEHGHQLLMTPLQQLSLGDMPHDARVIVPPTTNITSANIGSSSGAIHVTPEDIVIVQQSSKQAWFTLTRSQHVCRFYYDTGSDNLVLLNAGRQPIIVEPIDPGNSGITVTKTTVNERQILVMTPGPWRICHAGEVSQALIEFLILRRRYSLETRLVEPTGAGLKRKDASVIENSLKRRAVAHENDDESILVFNQPMQNQNQPVSDAAKTVDVGNPLIHLEPGTRLTIEMDRVASGSSSPRQVPTENYSIVNLRNIAKNKAYSSVFRAKHSRLGDTVVKVVTKSIEPASIPRIAKYWVNEERTMRDINHPSIIKFYESDARLYSIYMEYLPYPDLSSSAWMGRDSYFTGTVDDATCIFKRMASAIDYLEGKKLLHNDIKPANILYDRERGPVLIDFGLATTANDPPCRGGTPWYVPPELLHTYSRGFPSDIFALGVTTLYLLRKSILPERDRGHPMWPIFDIAEKQRPMKRWLENINGLQNNLGSTMLERTVKDTLVVLPRRRISARGILERFDPHHKQGQA